MAIGLSLLVPAVWGEFPPAVLAFAGAFHARREASPGSVRGGKSRPEEEISLKGSKKSNGRKRNSKPPGFLHFHFAADNW